MTTNSNGIRVLQKRRGLPGRYENLGRALHTVYTENLERDSKHLQEPGLHCSPYTGKVKMFASPELQTETSSAVPIASGREFWPGITMVLLSGGGQKRGPAMLG
ncbi:hypothetical protein CEXT_694401 [Caerostris extrusa]|uniref:Uncharacterized protein n=1 Tax=Caerostris extrusa TaxID=172846 RepID=A0AAV4XZT1_CAEEX|nr:hypothetical protein CEXT_694401 [Caerostris extrusa]